jgi:hypothetical protein
MLNSLMGAYYRKLSPGGYFNPPTDYIISPGASAQSVSSVMVEAVALGCAGVRNYAYDLTSSKTGRINAALNSLLQTGSDPLEAEVPHWRAMGYAANLLSKTLEPFILGIARSSPALGRNIVTAVREDDDGNTLLIVLNAADMPATLDIDISPYQTGNTITKYLLDYRSIRSSTMADAASDTVTLGDGASVFYLFPADPGTSWLTPVTISDPGSHAGTKAVLKYSYFYQDHLASEIPGVLCTPDCDLEWDLALGDVFYQFTYLNDDDIPLGKGPSVLYAP